MTDQVTILIAEDDTGHFALVQKNLWRSAVDNEIIHFQDGQTLLDFFFEPEASPRMVTGASYILLLDVRLPRVDGIEVLRRLKANDELSKIPVIMLTRVEDPAQVRECYGLGCSFYIVKPSDYTAFMECVEYLGGLLALGSIKTPRVGRPMLSYDLS